MSKNLVFPRTCVPKHLTLIRPSYSPCQHIPSKFVIFFEDVLLYVETKVKNVPVLHQIFLAFQAHFAGNLGGLLAPTG